MPFINSLVRVRSRCSGSVGLGGALFLSHTGGELGREFTVIQLVPLTVREFEVSATILKIVVTDYDTV